jgi:hypothetical protein
MLSLTVEKEYIHILNANLFEKEFKVIAEEKEFPFSIHQALFISTSFVQRFLNGEQVIALDFSNDKGISNEELLGAFTEFYSFFFEKTNIKINSANVQVFLLWQLNLTTDF